MNGENGERLKLYRIGQVILLVLGLFLVAQTINAFKENKYIGAMGVPSNVISVSGEGEVFAVPDIATVSFSVVEEAEDVATAQEEATAKMDQVLAALQGFGIEERDIQTVGYNVYPKYEYSTVACTQFSCPPSRQTLTGYEVSHHLNVKIRNVEQAGDVLSAIGGLNVTNVSGISFTIDDEDELQRQAREMAIEDAREKAEQLADDLDVRLVRIVSFSENGVSPIFMQKGIAYDLAVEEARGGAGSAPVPLPTGENRIVSHVTVTYEIR